MLKRITATLLTVAMLISFASCSCASGESAQTTTSASSTTATTTSSSATEDTTSTTENTTSTTTTTTSATSDEATTTPETSVTTTVPETSVTPDTTTGTTATTTKPSTTTTTAPTTTTTTTTTKEEQPDDPIERMEYQYEKSTEKYEKLYTRLEAKLDIPIISIITLDNKSIDSKEEYVTSMIDVVNCDDKYGLSALAGVRVRGNSTAWGNEKPYRIKFDKKQNLLGLHEGKEFKNWVLLKSQWNLAMDYMGFNLAKTILDGEYYSSDCTYVNVYINGKFKGIYLLCEQNQVNKNRVDVYEAEENETRTDIGYFLEIDNYAEEEPYYFTVDYEGANFTDINGKNRDFVSAEYTIKNDIYSDAQLKFIEKYTNNVFKILLEAVENNNPLMFDANYDLVSAEGVYTPQQAVEAVIDTKSLANLLILDELVHDYDVGEGSFFMAVDFTADSKYKKLTFTAPWDFNWAYDGSANGGYYASTFQPLANDIDRSNPWYIVAMKADWFQDIVKTKWAELYSSGALTATTAKVKKGVEALRNDLGDESWKIDSANGIVDFVNGRIKWLNRQWG